MSPLTFLFSLCVGVGEYVRSNATCVGRPVNSRREHQIPWSWTYECLWAAWTQVMKSSDPLEEQ